MRIKLWGTRGSLPRAMDHQSLCLLKSVGPKGSGPLTFGGATTCTEVFVKSQAEALFVDSGSGLAFASASIHSREIKKIHILQTHFHWDHIMGLPFFTPIYNPNCHIIVHSVHRTAEEDLKILFNGRNFPLTWKDLGARIEFQRHTLYQSFSIAEHKVTPLALDHPGGSFGYRFDSGSESFLVAVDSEFKRHTPDVLGKDLGFYQNLGTLLFDAQYDRDEIESKYDWGHCTPHKGIDLATTLGIKNIIFTHHDPMRNDEAITKMYDDAKQYLAHSASSTRLFMAYDGLEFELIKGELVTC